MAPFLVPTITPQQQAKKMAGRETSALAAQLNEKQRVALDGRYRRGTLAWTVNALALIGQRHLAIPMIRRAYRAGQIDMTQAKRLFDEIFGGRTRDLHGLLSGRRHRKGRKSRSVPNTPKPAISVDEWLTISGYDDEPVDDVAETNIEQRRRERALRNAGVEELAWEEAGWGTELEFGTWSNDECDDREWIEAGFRITTMPDYPLPTTLPTW